MCFGFDFLKHYLYGRTQIEAAEVFAEKKVYISYMIELEIMLPCFWSHQLFIFPHPKNKTFSNRNFLDSLLSSIAVQVPKHILSRLSKTLEV